MKNKNKKESKYNSSLGEIIDKYSYMNKDSFTFGVKFYISDMVFEMDSSIRRCILTTLVGMQTILLLFGVIFMFLPENLQLILYRLIPSIVIWMILVSVELVLSKLNKINKQFKLKLGDIYDAIDILNKNGDRDLIELIPTGYNDKNNVELCLGDIVYNKSDDDYWIIKKPSDEIKQKYGLDKSKKYVVVLGNDYSKGIHYLEDDNETIELAYRIGDDAYEMSFISLLSGTEADVIDVITKRN